MNYASAASRHPDFARELPRFVSEVRRIFTRDEIGAHLAQIERAPNENDIDVLEEDDPLRESPAEAEERVRQFLLIKELLTATMLGTS
jgi:DNA-binding SARP family transcriptional activator